MASQLQFSPKLSLLTVGVIYLWILCFVHLSKLPLCVNVYMHGAI